MNSQFITDNASALADRIRREAGSDLRAQLRRAWVLATTDGPAAALAAAEPLLEGPEGPALVWACVVTSYALAKLGRVETALEAAERGREGH